MRDNYDPSVKCLQCGCDPIVDPVRESPVCVTRMNHMSSSPACTTAYTMYVHPHYTVKLKEFTITILSLERGFTCIAAKGCPFTV